MEPIGPANPHGRCLAETTFHGTSTTYSWLIGALGAGAVVGGLYAARSARTGVTRLIWAALGYAITVGLLAAAPTLATAIAACVLAGVASPRYALGLGAAACLGAAIIGGWPSGGRRQSTS